MNADSKCNMQKDIPKLHNVFCRWKLLVAMVTMATNNMAIIAKSTLIESFNI